MPESDNHMKSRFMTLHETTSMLMSTLDLDDLLKEIAKQASVLTQARYCVLGIFDETGQYAHYIPYGIGKKLFTRMKGQLGMPKGEGVLSALYKGNKAIRLTNIPNHPAAIVFPDGHPAMTSFLGVPMVLEGRTVGVLFLTDRRDGKPFSEEDELLTTMLASTAALALRNSKLLKNIESQRDASEALNNVAGITSQGFTLEDLLSKVLDQVLNIQCLKLVAKGAIFLCDEKTEILILKVARNYPEEHLKLCTRVPFGKCLCGIVAAYHDSVFCSSCMTDERHAITYEGMQEHGHIILPLKSGAQLLGVLCLYLPPSYTPNKEERHLFDAIAAIISVGIKNAKNIQKITEKETRFRNIVETSSDWVWEVDAHGFYTFSSPKVYDLLGYHPGEILGKRPYDLMPKDEAERMEAYIDAMAENRIPLSLVENRNQHKDGHEVVIESSAVPLFDSAGNFSGYRGIDRDITERKLAVEKLRQYSQQLEEKVSERTKSLEQSNADLRAAKKMADSANRAKSAFLANMSHELRTPLNSIIGFGDILKQGFAGDLNDDQMEYIRDIVDSGDHLLELINEILDLSKVEAGKMEFNSAEVDVSTLINRSLMFIKEKTLRHGITVESEIDAKLGTITGDEIRLKQVMVNLLSNAAKFTPDHGRIMVKARRLAVKELSRYLSAADTLEVMPAKEYLLVSVADTGRGISPEDLAKLFQPFYQTGSVLVDKPEGTGLGLVLSKKFIEHYGGWIWAASDGEGKGAEFSFVIPYQVAGASIKPFATLTGEFMPWQEFLHYAERIMDYHRRHDLQMGLCRFVKEKKISAARQQEFCEIFTKGVRNYEMMATRKGECFLVLLDVNQQKLAGALGRINTILAGEDFAAEMRTALFPEDGDTTEQLVKKLMA